MADYASNSPVSLPVIHAVTEERSFGGMSWNDKIGLYFPVEDEVPPFRLPMSHPSIQQGLR